jgi:hypothetical protein
VEINDEVGFASLGSSDEDYACVLPRWCASLLDGLCRTLLSVISVGRVV